MFNIFHSPYFTLKASILVSGSISTYFIYRQGKYRYKQAQFSTLYENQNFNRERNQDYFIQSNNSKPNLLAKFTYFLQISWRFVNLIIRFTPVFLYFPFAYLLPSLFQDSWIKLLLFTLKNLGPFWIKLSQWASHRGDVFGHSITSILSQLRESNQFHDFEYSKQQFKKDFNQDINSVFEQLERIPVASGSIAQIYRGRLNGEDVAIKIQHPDIHLTLDLDLQILFSISKIFHSVGGFFGNFAIPVNFKEFGNTLLDQLDFRLEAKNLELFASNFKDQPNIRFPKVYHQYVSERILVESFEKGMSLTELMKQQSNDNLKIAANLGLKSFYKMLMYDNFIHADLHAGNILIQSIERKEYSLFQRVQFYFEDKSYQMIDWMTQLILPFFEAKILGKEINILQQQKLLDEFDFWEFLRVKQLQTNQIQLIYVDPGMVTILNQEDRQTFIKLVVCVVLRQPKLCSEIMLNLLNKKIPLSLRVQQKFQAEIEGLFDEFCQLSLDKMSLGLIFQQMIDILRLNHLQIDGHFAILLANMMVMEGMARQLDPNLNIVSKAASFILQIKTIDSAVNDIINAALSNQFKMIKINSN